MATLDRLRRGMNLLRPGSIDHHGKPAQGIGSQEILGWIVTDVNEARAGAAERGFNQPETLMMRLGVGAAAAEGIRIDDFAEPASNPERFHLAHLQAMTAIRDQPEFQLCAKMRQRPGRILK